MPKIISTADDSGGEQLQESLRPSARILTTAVLYASLALSGCAPDAFRPDAPYEDFLNRVQAKCQYQRIGRVQIDSEFLQDPYFLDLTSRFYHGEVSQENYVKAIQGLTTPSRIRRA